MTTAEMASSLHVVYEISILCAVNTLQTHIEVQVLLQVELHILKCGE